MATVYDVAQYILAKYPTLEAMKLQKLVYYSQAWHTVRADAPMFPEPVKAYENGPVVGRLFYRHKGCFRVTAATIGVGSASGLTYDEAMLVDAVLGHYGHLSAETLSDMTHAEDPWKDAWGFRNWDDTIAPTSMRDYYARRLVEAPSEAPRLPSMAVTYVLSDDLAAVLSDTDEADDFTGFLTSLGEARVHLGA